MDFKTSNEEVSRIQPNIAETAFFFFHCQSLQIYAAHLCSDLENVAC